MKTVIEPPDIRTHKPPTFNTLLTTITQAGKPQEPVEQPKAREMDEDDEWRAYR